MKILVTGPDGLLGNNLIRELIRRGHEIVALVEKGKRAPTLEALPIQLLEGNLLDPQSLQLAFEGVQAVYHCAAATGVVPARNEMVCRVNVEGTKHIVDLCIRYRVHRLICVGTANSFTFGTSKFQPGTENSAYVCHRYGLDYMDSKYEAQRLVLNAVKEHALPAIILNPTFMIGPYDTRPSSGAMLLALKKGAIPAYSPGGKNYIAVKDVAIAAANALDRGRIGECYILGNENLTYKEAFYLFASWLQVNPPRLHLPAFLILFYGKVSSVMGSIFSYHPKISYELARISCDHHYYNSAKARKELLLPQTPLKEAVLECMGWFEENGYS